MSASKISSNSEKSTPVVKKRGRPPKDKKETSENPKNIQEQKKEQTNKNKEKM